MKIQVLKNESYDDESKLPVRSTERSTGNDIVATSDPEIIGVKNNTDDTGQFWKSIDYIQYRTNLFVSIQKDTNFDDYDILGFPRSSVSKYNLTLANSICLIDADYRGEITLRFKYIWQPEDLLYVPTLDGNKTEISGKITGKPNLEKIYKKGDKICQLKVTKVEDVEFRLVEKLDETVRGTGGFGSTDKNPQSFIPDHIIQLYKSIAQSEPQRKYVDLVKERENL